MLLNWRSIFSKPMAHGKWCCAMIKCVLSTQRGCSRQNQMLTETSSATKHAWWRVEMIIIFTGKIIFALSEIWGLSAHHRDVLNAYVKATHNPDLDIYLYVPQGIKVSKKELQRCGAQHTKQVVIRLQRSLYGLKQARRLWAQLLHSELLRVRFVQCVIDSCLYYKGDHDGKTVVRVYLDYL